MKYNIDLMQHSLLNNLIKNFIFKYINNFMYFSL